MTPSVTATCIDATKSQVDAIGGKPEMNKKCKGCGEWFDGLPKEDFCESCINEMQDGYEFQEEYVFDVAEVDQE